jgi:hypothetical protein
MENNKTTVKWIAVIVGIFIMVFSAAYGAVQMKLNKHDELIMEIREDMAGLKAGQLYIIRKLEGR